MVTPEEAIKILTGKMIISPSRCCGKTYTMNKLREVVIKALQKQIPRMPYYEYGEMHCYVCGCIVTADDSYCPECGQAIDWWDEFT